ncbi:hypothetical protein ACHQM5_016857 [Ranunculus cassubicifolius]
MAAHPPSNTLKHDLRTGAFPNTAPTTPNTNNAAVSPINTAASRGTIAPTENANADASAAWAGLGNFSALITSSLSSQTLFI